MFKHQFCQFLSLGSGVPLQTQIGNEIIIPQTTDSTKSALCPDEDDLRAQNLPLPNFKYKMEPLVTHRCL